MKYITSNLALSMFQLREYLLSVHELEEDEFQALIFDGYSCVGYEDVAEAINVAYNKEPVKARPGDVILCANLQHGTLRFYCIQVLEQKNPLFRQRIDEEMTEWL